MAKAGARAQIEFNEWTPDGHLRHSTFVGLRDDKEASDVVRKSAIEPNEKRRRWAAEPTINSGAAANLSKTDLTPSFFSFGW